MGEPRACSDSNNLQQDRHLQMLTGSAKVLSWYCTLKGAVTAIVSLMIN
jgi:hypothetical protein